MKRRSPLKGDISGTMTAVTSLPSRCHSPPPRLKNSSFASVYLPMTPKTAAAKPGLEAFLDLRLIDSLGQAVWATDLEGVVTYWNPAAEGLFGFPGEEAMGCNVKELLVPTENRAHAEQTSRLLISGQPWSGEVPVRDKGGRVFPTLLTASPLCDADGIIMGVVGVSVDLTERKKAEASRAALACLVETSADAIVATSPDLLISSFNPAAERLFGYAADEVIGKPVALLALPERRTPTGTVLTDMLGRGEVVREIPSFGVRKDGAQFHLLLSAASADDEQGETIAISWIMRDVTGAVEAERALAESERRFRGVFDASPFGMVLVTEKRDIVEVNRAFATMIGRDPRDLVECQIAELVHPDDRRAGRDAFGALFDHRVHSSRLEKRYLHRDGSIRWGNVTGVRLEPQDGGARMVLAIVDDVTEKIEARHERERLIAELQQRNVTDELTGLPNRALLEEYLGRAVQRRWNPRSLVGVIFIDVDRLKVVNDSVGHAAGDLLLVEVARRLSGAVRPGDLVGRFGGDEFVVVAEDAHSAADLVAVADRILAVLGDPLEIAGLSLRSSASLGIACTEDPDETAAAILSNADLAMHRAKRRGGGCAEVFHPRWREGAMTRLVQEVDLRRAIDDGQLEVHYQPYLTPGRRVVGVEALVRWSHPARGMLSPSEFIPLAEETGLIVPLGRWVLERACEQVVAWRSSGHPDLVVAVNLSVRQLASPELVPVVAEVLAASQLPTEALCLEVTETALTNDQQELINRLNELRNMGVSIAIDDFGTGYSSLLRLRHLPAQVLKLDRCFVSGLVKNAEDSAIVHSVIDLAHALGHTAIAEGVETAEQAAVLGGLHCDLLQGNYWSPPVEASEMTAFLQRHSAAAIGEPRLAS